LCSIFLRRYDGSCYTNSTNAPTPTPRSIPHWSTCAAQAVPVELVVEGVDIVALLVAEDEVVCVKAEVGLVGVVSVPLEMVETVVPALEMPELAITVLDVKLELEGVGTVERMLSGIDGTIDGIDKDEVACEAASTLPRLTKARIHSALATVNIAANQFAPV